MESIVDEMCLVHGALTSASLDQLDLINFVHQVIENNWENMSSMQQDVEHGRRTEIDVLNGWVTRMGEAHGVACPVNASLTQKIKDVEATFT